jgi:pilus assembly protein CpaF
MNGELAARAEEIHRQFSSTWTLDARDLTRPPVETVLRNLVDQSPPALVPRLEREFFAAGPVQNLIEDREISEIVINGRQEIWYEKHGRLQKGADCFLTDTTFKNFIDRVCAESAMRIDLSRPFADGRWNGFRVHLARSPLTHCDFHVTLRRVPENPWTLELLEKNGWASAEHTNLLRSQIEERKNIIFIGATGSGKTSVLGACLKALPEEERVVIVEDTDELPRPNSASTKMLTRSSSSDLTEVTLTDLVKQSLRMRPFRLVLGEARGGEAKDLLMALATGHSGSLGTLHASDPRQALLRLEMLVQMGAPQWGQQAIRQLIHLSVQTIVLCGMDGGQRRLKGIFKVAALESFGFLLEQLA